MDILWALKSCNLFKEFTAKDLESVSGVCKVRSIHPGQDLFSEGEKPEAFFIVVKGTLKLKKFSQKGDEENIANVGAPAYLGELGMLDNEKRNVSAAAGENTDVVEVPYAALESLLKTNPTLRGNFYFALALNLAQQIRRTTEDLTSVKAMKLRHV